MSENISSFPPASMSEESEMRYSLLALAVALVAHLWTLPAWISIGCLSLWAFRYFLIVRRLPTIPRLVKSLLTFFALYGLMLTYGRYTVDSCVALLAIASGLMPFESRSHRDRLSLVVVAILLALTALFQSQNLIVTSYLILTAIVSTSALIMLNRCATGLPQAFRLTGRLGLYSLPLVILLFFAFPRVSGNLWSFGGTDAAATGFSESFSPGDVSKLISDDSVAFRATFEGAIPESRDRYWRGIVFNNFDGRTWRLGYRAPARKAKLVGSDPIEYKIVLEPHFSKWLFALDYAQSIFGVSSRIGQDFTFQLWAPLRDRLQYRVVSYKEITWEDSPDPSTLALPSKGNPRSRELAEKWKNAGLSAEEIVREAAKMFSSNGFSYSLIAPLLGADLVDDFLFKSKKGFCEHYATSLAFLLRSAGIPARVVGGYLGGDINTVGNYVIVRQSDAHVWVEAWLPEKGWSRVDPTAFVSPSRVEQGSDAIFAEGRLPFFLSDPRFSGLQNVYKKALFYWDNINFAWDRWMLDYSSTSQREIFKKLGVELSRRYSQYKLILIILSGFALTFFLVYLRLKFATVHRDKTAAVYAKFITRVEKLGVRKPPSMGPLHFLQLLASYMPEREAEAREIIEIYTKLRYRASEETEELLKTFKKAVKEF